MNRIRLFVPEPITTGESLWLTGERAHYLSRVLRIRSGDTIVIFNGQGGEFETGIGTISRQKVELLPGAHSSHDLESRLKIRLMQGVSRGDRMDTVVQKATELGVHRISPVLTEFSVVRLDSKRSQKKSDHWERIAQSACEQCGRNTVPQIDAPVDLRTLLAMPYDGSGVLLVPGGSSPLAGMPGVGDAVAMLIGPEGGLNDVECQLATERGFQSMSIGPRILRTETAALTAIAVLQSRFGDLSA